MKSVEEGRQEVNACMYGTPFVTRIIPRGMRKLSEVAENTSG